MFYKLVLLISATAVVAIQDVQLRAQSLDETGNMYQTYTIPNIRSQIKGEVASALTDEAWWDSLPQNIRKKLKPVMGKLSNSQNQLYNAIKKQISKKLKTIGGQNKLVMDLVPDNIKNKVGSTITGMADNTERTINNALKSFPQTSSETLVESETELLAQKLL